MSQFWHGALQSGDHLIVMASLWLKWMNRPKTCKIYDTSDTHDDTTWRMCSCSKKNILLILVAQPTTSFFFFVRYQTNRLQKWKEPVPSLKVWNKLTQWMSPPPWPGSKKASILSLGIPVWSKMSCHTALRRSLLSGTSQQFLAVSINGVPKKLDGFYWNILGVSI